MKHDQLRDDLAMIGRNAIDEIIALRKRVTDAEADRDDMARRRRQVEDDIARIRHQRRVMADIIADALAVIQTIEGENTDEEDSLRALRNRMSAAISHVAREMREQSEPDPIV